MPCYRPLTAYRKGGEIKFKIPRSQSKLQYEKLTIPCGQCIGCRIRRTRMWAVRCVHEASLYQQNIFITLTYDEEHLPDNRSLNKTHFQGFMKRLRKKHPNQKIRYYMCGEYGGKLGRPHYHALIFNFDFEDKYFWRTSKKNTIYRSPTLERLWPFGLSDIGSVTAQSANYVAGYIQKKITGKQANLHYQWFDENTGEVYDRLPEYNSMSLKPGIGKLWYDKYWKDVFPTDTIHDIEGKRLIVPDYYLDKLEVHCPAMWEMVKIFRKEDAEEYREINAEDLKKQEYAINYNRSTNPRKGLT